MKERNYLLVYHYTLTDEIVHRYFETEETMNEYIKEQIDNKWCVLLHKYEIKEIK